MNEEVKSYLARHPQKGLQRNADSRSFKLNKKFPHGGNFLL